MSVKIMGAIWELDLPQNKRLVLLAMGDHADHDGGNVFPSIALIAWKTGYSERQVQRIVQGLVKDGLLVKQKSATNRAATVYAIDTSKGKPKPALNALRGDKMSPQEIKSRGDIAKSSRGDIIVSPHRGDIIVSPESSVLEPSENHQENTLQPTDAVAPTPPSDRQQSHDETTPFKESGERGAEGEASPKVAARAPLPHIHIIEQFVLPLKDVLPTSFKLGPYARLGMDMLKAQETPERAAAAGALYRAWYEATPGHQSAMLSWTVGGVTAAMRIGLSLARAGITAAQVHAFLATRYAEDFWQDKTVSWKHVGEQIIPWSANSKPKTRYVWVPNPNGGGEIELPVEDAIERGLLAS